LKDNSQQKNAVSPEQRERERQKAKGQLPKDLTELESYLRKISSEDLN